MLEYSRAKILTSSYPLTCCYFQTSPINSRLLYSDAYWTSLLRCLTGNLNLLCPKLNFWPLTPSPNLLFPTGFLISGSGRSIHPVAQTKKYLSYLDPSLPTSPQIKSVSKARKIYLYNISRIESLLTNSTTTFLVYTPPFLAWNIYTIQ